MFYADVMMGVWKKGESVAVFLINVTDEDVVRDVGLNLEGWGFEKGDVVECSGEKIVVEGGVQVLEGVLIASGEVTVLGVRH